MDGERIDDVVGHPLLGGAARGLAGWFDWCHEHAETCLYASPTTGQAGQRLLPAAALARGSRAPPHRHAPHGGVPRRRDGPRARLPQRDVRAVRRARRRVGPPRQRARRRESRPLLRADARARPLDDARDHEPAGRPLAARRGGGRRRDRAAQGRRDGRGHRRARRAHARDARALRGRDLDLPGQPAAARGHRLRALLRAADEHARASRSCCATRSRSRGRPSTTRSRRASTSRTGWSSSTTSSCPRTASSWTATRSATTRSSRTRTGARRSSTRR